MYKQKETLDAKISFQKEAEHNRNLCELYIKESDPYKRHQYQQSIELWLEQNNLLTPDFFTNLETQRLQYKKEKK